MEINQLFNNFNNFTLIKTTNSFRQFVPTESYTEAIITQLLNKVFLIFHLKIWRLKHAELF